MSSDIDELNISHMEILGFDFDYETPLKSPSQRTHNHLKRRATKYHHMSPARWNKYIYIQSEFCNGTVCLIFKNDGSCIKLYAIVGMYNATTALSWRI